MTADLAQTLALAHEIMGNCKTRLCNADILRNIIDLRPVLHNKTRWSGKLHMLQRFLQSRDELIEVSNDRRSDFHVNSSVNFKRKVERYCTQLQQNDFATRELQTRKISLFYCKNVLDWLVADVRSGFRNSSSPCHLFFLKTKCIGCESENLQDCMFEMGV